MARSMKRSRPIENFLALVVDEDKESVRSNFATSGRKRACIRQNDERRIDRQSILSEAWSDFFSANVIPPVSAERIPPPSLVEDLRCFSISEEVDLSCWDFDQSCVETAPVGMITREIFKLHNFVQKPRVVSLELRPLDCSSALMSPLRLSEWSVFVHHVWTIAHLRSPKKSDK